MPKADVNSLVPDRDFDLFIASSWRCPLGVHHLELAHLIEIQL
jgi:hypothetical protein